MFGRRSNRCVATLTIAVALLFSVAASAQPVEVVGLFKGRAILRTPQGEALLRVGETTTDGVKLVEATAKHAIVTYRGERMRLALSGRIGTQFQKSVSRQVSINADQLGQYRVRGLVNEQPATFLVDTGASVVAMSSRLANQLGIDYEHTGKRGTVVTASGRAKSHFVLLNEVTIGALTRRNVRAAVVEGDYPVEILLGMSFLRDVQLQENNGVLLLGAASN